LPRAARERHAGDGAGGARLRAGRQPRSQLRQPSPERRAAADRAHQGARGRALPRRLATPGVPVSEWKAIDEGAGLFELEKVAPGGWCWRAVAVRLPDGSALMVSPIRGTLAASAASLEAIGRLSFALAPNHFHYLGLREARERARAPRAGRGSGSGS